VAALPYPDSTRWLADLANGPILADSRDRPTASVCRVQVVSAGAYARVELSSNASGKQKLEPDVASRQVLSDQMIVIGGEHLRVVVSVAQVIPIPVAATTAAGSRRPGKAQPAARSTAG
jgi:hypothetical protein